MKLTLIREDKKNQMHVTQKSMESLMERITKDTKTEDVQALRRYLASPEDKELVERYTGLLHRIYPSAELVKDINGNLTVRAVNGIVMLSVQNVLGHEALERVKQLAAQMPTTLAAFVGSSGRSVKVLVRVEKTDGTVPQTEVEANDFLQAAYDFVVAPYQALMPYTIQRQPATTHTSFRMTLDEKPFFRPKATAFQIVNVVPTKNSAPVEAVASSPNYDLYMEYERLYMQAMVKTNEMAGEDPNDNAFFAELARQMCLLGIPEEEAFTHVWDHHKYNPPLPKMRLRTIIEAVYTETKPDRRKLRPKEGVGRETHDIIHFLENRYVFRYNTVMGYTEYRPNNTGHTDWQPVDERVINGFTTDARLSGLNIWDKDVTRYIKSDKVRNFDPIEDYLWRVHAKWDGQDHIGRLACTIPTDNPHWPRWFRTWFLAMVAQWKGRNRRYGNSVAPLLISSQGYNKSTFCRSLLPEELQRYYNDNLPMKNDKDIYNSMSSMALINIDEFDSITDAKHPILKYLLSKHDVKIRPPYGKSIEQRQRFASFIATTNNDHPLTDPTGSRRFVCVHSETIDNSGKLNYNQIYAQLKCELDNGEQYWFTDKENARIMQSNERFRKVRDYPTMLTQTFLPVNETPKDAPFMPLTDVMNTLANKYAEVKVTNGAVTALGKFLRSMGYEHKKTSRGSCYRIILL